jgi:hypothetical protein
MPCQSDEECTDPDAPFCGTTGECGTCDAAKDPDGACAGVDPGLPLCVGGACVQCTAAAPEACTGKTPVCDGTTNTCVPCDAHDQCGEAACNLFTGACLPDDDAAVVHVGGATPDFDDLTAAVASFAAGDEGTILVHEPMASYDESVTVDGGRVLAFLAAADAAAPPGWILSGGGAPQLAVTMGSTVLIDGLRMSGNANDVVLSLDGGRVWLDRTRIVQNSGGGIVAQNAAELVLRNCFVGGNGAGLAGSFGIDVVDSDVRVLYTTVARNDEATIDSIRCMGSTVDVRNSIVVGRDANSIECPGIVISNSALDETVGTNPNVGAADPTWFVDATSDFHLTAAGAMVFADVALWNTGDPPTDIDGDPRPAVDVTSDHAGADVP